MKRILLFLGALLTIPMYGQFSSATGTYSLGDLPTQFNNNPNTSIQSTCSDTLTITITPGNWVVGLDLTYSMTALGLGWMSEQRSYLECVSCGTSEPFIFSGSGNSAGTVNYNRTSLSFANGAVPTGELKFVLHGFRTFSASPSCGNTINKIDNNWTVTVYHGLPPTCFQPSNLSVVSVGPNSVNLSWTGGGASAWQIEYGPPGFILGTGTLVNAPTNPFTVTGLTPNTTYDFVVRDSCGTNDVSWWSPRQTATTSCVPALAPYLEDFSGASWVSGTGTSTTNPFDAINGCWSRSPGGNTGFSGAQHFWGTRQGTTPSGTFGLTGPSGDHTTGTGKYIYTETALASPSTATITSPSIDLSPLTVPELRFWYHMYGPASGGIGTLNVEVNGGSGWTSVMTLTGNQQTSQSAAWKEAIIPLAAFADDTIQVRFSGTRIGASGDISVDDVQLLEAPSCPQPSNLSFGIVGATTVELDWIPGIASNWNIEYGPNGFTPGTGTIVNAGAHPFTVPGLNPSTTYDFYVRDSCGAGDVSFWVGPITTTTLCLAVPAPWSQNFDGTNWTPGSTFGAQGTIDPCWSRNTLTNYFWKPGPEAFSLTNTGPSADHTSGSGKYVFTMTSGSISAPTSAQLRSPQVDLTPLTNPQLSFWYHMYGNGIGSLEVQINDGSGFVTVHTITGEQQTSQTEDWLELILPLTAYAGDTIEVRFRANKTLLSTATRIALDDIAIVEAPSCPKPQFLEIDAVTSTTATLSWTTGGASVWQIEYGTSGFSPGSGTVVTASTNPFTISGLSPNTTYDFYVRDSCAAGDVSVWVGPETGTTNCAPFVAPWSEDFESPDFAPRASFTSNPTFSNCWTVGSGNIYVWNVGIDPFNTTFNTGPTADHTPGSGTQFIYTFSDGFSASGGSQSIESPLIDLSSLTVPELTFWYHMYGADMGTMTLEINNGGSTWTNLWTQTGQQQTSETDPWEEEIISLAAYAGDTVKLRFTGSISGFDFFSEAAIDDVDIHETPTCPKPVNLSVTSTTTTTATLSWTTGGASAWQVEYGPPGFTAGTGTLVNALTNPFTVTGLNPSTTYDFYVRDSCGTGDVSAWSEPATGTTQCAPVPAPWTENFDGADFTPGTTFAGPGTVHPCWNRNVTTGYFWRPGPSVAVGFNTGPSADHTSGSGKYLSSKSNGAVSLPANARITTPDIDLSPLNIPEMSFWYHMYGSDIGSLQVEISLNGTSWTNLLTLTGQEQSSSTDDWEEAIVNLSAYADDTVRFRFTANKTVFGFSAESAIDDIDIHEQPSCPKPSDLSITSVSDTSVTLSWTSGGATSWQIEYGPPGFTPGTGTLLNVTGNPYMVVGLTPSTQYDFYVRDSCGVGDVSAWSSVEEGATAACATPCYYTLDMTDTFGDGWNGCAVTVTVDGITTEYTLAFGSSGSATIEICDSLTVELAVSVVAGFPTEVGFVLKDADNNVLYQHTPGSLTLGVKYSGLGDCGACADPTALAASNITFSSVDLTWTSGGGPTAQIQYGTTGFALGSGIIVAALGNPASQGGLIPNTTYDFYVRENCAGGPTAWIGPVTITTLPCPTPVANFTYTLSGYTLNVDGTSTTGATVYAWDWGDGSPLIGGTTASHTFTGDGVYTVTLMVDNSCAPADSFAIDIAVCAPMTAGFNVNTALLGATFTSTTTGNPTDFYWDFGDGNSGTGNAPVHTYGSDGSYTVTLTTVNLCGDSSVTDQTIEVCGPLTAGFTYNAVGETITFDGSTSSAGATDFSWYFGTGDSDVGQSVSYTYPASGTFVVTLVVENLCGDVDSVQQTITVCAKPVAVWTYTILSTTGSGMQVQFDGTASLNAVDYFWNFGDGNTATGTAFPVHTYITPGLFYQVTLIAYNSCGGSDTLSFKLNEIGVEELEGGEMNLFPNPTGGKLTLELPGWKGEIAEVQVVDAGGRAVYELNGARLSADGKLEMNFDFLPPGQYFLRVTRKGETFGRRFMISE